MQQFTCQFNSHNTSQHQVQHTHLPMQQMKLLRVCNIQVQAKLCKQLQCRAQYQNQIHNAQNIDIKPKAVNKVAEEITFNITLCRRCKAQCRSSPYRSVYCKIRDETQSNRTTIPHKHPLPDSETNKKRKKHKF